MTERLGGARLAYFCFFFGPLDEPSPLTAAAGRPR
jgi:hypothetical protein